MSRFGVTYAAVAQAAEGLKREGVQPTVERVRLHLGTGSNSTIAKYLNEWRLHGSATHAAAHLLKSNTPDPVKLAVEKVWQEINEQAQQEMATLKEDWQRKYTELEAAHEAVCKERDSLQTNLTETSQREREIFTDKEMLSIQLRNQTEETHLMQERCRGLAERLTEQQTFAALQLTSVNDAHACEIARLTEIMQQQRIQHETAITTLHEQHNHIKSKLECELNNERLALQQTLAANLQQANELTFLTKKLQEKDIQQNELQKEIERLQQQLAQTLLYANENSKQSELSKEILASVTALLKFNLPFDMTCVATLSAAQHEMHQTIFKLEALAEQMKTFFDTTADANITLATG